VEDYYRTLGVTRDATPSVVKIAYEGQLKALERSKLDPAQRAAEEKVLSQAYVTLSTPAKKAWYDQKLAEAPEARPERPMKALIAAGVAVVMVAGCLAWYFQARTAERERLEAQRIAIEREAAKLKAEQAEEARLAAENERREQRLQSVRQGRESTVRYRRESSSEMYQRVDRVLDAGETRDRYNMGARDRAEQRYAEDRARRQADEDLRKARVEAERQKRFVDQQEREEERIRTERHYRVSAETEAQRRREAAAAEAAKR
jgi:hypothetical protein